ncbi:putative YapH protein [Flavobacteriales bacterium ALC-1]|nr:putative YapH protein [Flavobacteriales bacterium ALC-1]
MKTKLTFLMLLISIILFAQNGINYKALIKDTNGNVISNETIQIRFSIIRGSGILAYQETQNITTTNSGLAIVTIGEGVPLGGVTFDQIDWSLDSHELAVSIDLGSGFINMGSSDINYVPYSIRASSATTAEVAGNVEGLVYKNEGNGTGWRLRDRGVNASEGYGAIGLNAIDLSSSDANSLSLIYPYGATGDYSFAIGELTIANGDYSIAMGYNSRASGAYSIAMGNNTVANGFSSTATGRETLASGNYTIAFGRDSEASGSQAVAMGDNTEASGITSISTGYYSRALGAYSAVFGYYNEASSLASVAFGRYNVGGGNALNWIGNDPLFEIGIGTSDGNRENAVTVLKNGNVGIGNNNPQELLHVSGIVRIGNETLEDTGSNQLSFGASVIPDTNNAYRLGNSSSRWIGVWATDGTINTSDKREKKNIKELNYGLAEVLQMQPVSFNWKNKNNPDLKLGLIAQDLQTLIPEVVKSHTWEKDEISGQLTKKELERLGVYYSDLVPVLINAIKEQQDQIKTLKSTLQNKEKTNQEQSQLLKSLLDRVEALEQSNN